VDPQVHQQLLAQLHHQQQQLQAQHQQLQELQAHQQQQPIPAAPAVQQVQVRIREQLPPPNKFEGVVGVEILNWLESLEPHHAYYERDDASKVIATVAMLGEVALREYTIATKKDPDIRSSYANLCEYLKKRWNFVEAKFIIRRSLDAVIEKGPSLPVQKYVEQFQRFACLLEGSSAEMAEELVFLFIKGLKPVHKTKVHEKSFTSYHEAIKWVCKSDSHYHVHHSPSSAVDMDLSGVEQEEAATTSVPTSSASAGLNAIAALQHQITSLTEQFNSITFRKSRAGKNDNRPGAKPGLQTVRVPNELAQLRKVYGYCMKCGVVKFTKGEQGHNSRTCTKPVDTSTKPAEFLQGKAPPNFQ
jgi:hypothetical protein